MQHFSILEQNYSNRVYEDSPLTLSQPLRRGRACGGYDRLGEDEVVARKEEYPHEYDEHRYGSHMPQVVLFHLKSGRIRKCDEEE